MTQTTLQKIIRERRAIKKGYTNEPVSETAVKELLNDAIWAPTHGNRQPWRFIFIDKENLPSFAKKVAKTYPETMQENRENYLNEPNAILVVLMQEAEKIGRASCREREKIAAGGGGGETRDQRKRHTQTLQLV